MEKKSVTFSVKMTAKEVYRYTLYHVYHGFSGIFGLCLSLIALVNLIVNFNNMSDQAKTVMIIIALWSTVIDPLMMKSRCKAQFKRTKAYENPLQYCIDEQGVTVSQNEENQTIEWEKLCKIVETKSQFLVYSSRIHAFIFPKSMLDGQAELVKQLILDYTKHTGIQLKGKLKKLQKTKKD